MSDLDRDLREMFQRHESDLVGPVATPERLVRRVRRRQAGMVLSATLGVVMVVAIAVAILALGDDPNQRVPGVSPTPSTIAPFEVGPAPDLGTTDLGGIRIPVPSGWYLSSLDDHQGGAKVALSNFAPALTGPDPCTGMPADGVLLVIDPLIARTAASWPPDLRESPAGSLDCGSTHLHAAWTTEGRSYRAAVAIGPSTTTADRDLLRRTFGTLAFDPSSAAVGLDGFGYCFTQPFDAYVVVASGSFDGRDWTAAENPSCGDGFDIAVSGGTTTGGTGFSGLGGPTDVVVTDYLDRGDTFVLGGVPIGGTRVTIDAGGPAVSVPLIPLAANRDVAAFVAPLDGIRTGIVATRDASGDVLAAVRFSPGMDCEYRSVCATGVPADGVVARSLPDEPVGWTLEEHEGALTLVDERGAVLGEVAASSGPLSAGTVQLSKEGQGMDLVFGIAPADTSAVFVYQRSSREPFAAQTVSLLYDGRLVYWIEPVHNGARTVATFDASCRPQAAVDATTGNPTAQPSVTSCSRIQGVW